MVAVAQRTEHRAVNPGDAGSNPAGHPKHPPRRSAEDRGATNAEAGSSNLSGEANLRSRSRTASGSTARWPSGEGTGLQIRLAQATSPVRLRSWHPSTPGLAAHLQKESTMQSPILALDIAGTPRKWVTAQTAVTYYARGVVGYEFGDSTAEFRGGWQRCGKRSRIRVSSIIAVLGPEFVAGGFDRAPVLSNEKLFARDRRLCAYCGMQFRDRDLSRDHIVPVARGGRRRLDEPGHRLSRVQRPQGKPPAGGSRYAAAIPPLRAIALGGLHPGQSSYPGGPDGVLAGQGAREQSSAQLRVPGLEARYSFQESSVQRNCSGAGSRALPGAPALQNRAGVCRSP